MRDAFARALLACATEDDRVVLLSGDIGNRMFDRFKEACPGRFFNCGVAEANMMSVAAGMAMSGLRPVVYTIIPFLTARCLEQIRVDVCYHRQPVTIVGVGGGLSYASLGSTHHALEDIGMLRVLPEMNIVCPADPREVGPAVRAALTSDRPTYVRLGKKGEAPIHESEPEIEIGKSLAVRAGARVALLSVGHVLPIALETADNLEANGVSTRVDSFHTVKPLDEECLADVFSRYELVVTLEEHSVIGGAGSAVAEWLADHPGIGVRRARLLRIGSDDLFLHGSGGVAHARERIGLTSERIAARVMEGLP